MQIRKEISSEDRDYIKLVIDVIYGAKPSGIKKDLEDKLTKQGKWFLIGEVKNNGHTAWIDVVFEPSE